jgi:hypothetical protein
LGRRRRPRLIAAITVERDQFVVPDTATEANGFIEVSRRGALQVEIGGDESGGTLVSGDGGDLTDSAEGKD